MSRRDSGITGPGIRESMHQIYDQASKEATQKYPSRPGIPSDTERKWQRDAYRHCLASFLATEKEGRLVAKFGGWANEKGRDWGDNQDQGERKMDDHNNRCGRDAGANQKDERSCSEKCKSLLEGGHLDTSGSSGEGYWE